MRFDLVISMEGDVLEAELIYPDEAKLDSDFLLKIQKMIENEVKFFSIINPDEIYPQEYEVVIRKQ